MTDAFPTWRGRLEYVCLGCGARYPADDLLYTCPQCGGVFLLQDLDFNELKKKPGAEWRALFNARAATRVTALRGIFRFYELLAPVLDEEDIVYLGEGQTPIVGAARRFQAEVGCDFAFKNDGQNPSASFKDRGMACAFSYIEVLDNAKHSNFSNLAEKIHAYCKAFRNFYDMLLGKNASEKIFAGIKDNMRKYDEIYTSLLDFIAEQRAVTSNRMNQLKKKYAPQRIKK